MRFPFFALLLCALPSVVRATPSLPNDFGCDDLEKFIRVRKIRSIEELLPQLPESTRANYTLVHDTRSIQGASECSPRVVMFGGTARTVISFNGDESQPGFHFLEVIEQDEATKKFKTCEISFETRSPTFEHGPNKCVHCHGIDPRPIFNSYSQWRGVVGSNDDLIYSHEDYKGSNEEKSVPNAVRDAKALECFLSRKATHSRYSALISDPTSKIGGYRSGYTSKTGYPGGFNGDPDRQKTPNRRLTYLLTVRNLDRLAKEITQSPAWAPLKYGLVEKMLCGCKNGQACDPKEIPSIFKKAHSYSGLSHVAACDALRQVGQPGVGTEPLLRFFGVPHGDTSINFEQGSRDGGNTGYISMRGDLEPTGHLSLQLLREIAKKDSALAAQLNPFLGNLESSLNFGSAYGKSATKFLNGKGWEEFVKFTQDRMLTREFKQKDLYSLCSYLSSKAAKEIKLLDRHRDKCANCRDKNSPPVELDLEKCAEIKPGLKTAAKDIFTRFRCETCHDDPSGSVARVHPGIPYIPFLNAKALCKEQESSLNSYDNLFAKIKGAVDAANTTYRTMPYNARASTLQDEEREIIENYLNRLCKP